MKIPTVTGQPALDPWFLGPDPSPDAEVVLFCLPHAGGGGSTFQGWPSVLGREVDVEAVQLPGRERRLGEPPVIDAAAVATAVAGRARSLDRPYAIYGHSFGALLAHEVVRQLIHRRAPLPLRMYVAGCRPPDQLGPRRLRDLERIGDRPLAHRLADLGGMPREVLAEDDLLELVLPAIRADLAWSNAHRGWDGQPLPVPIVALAGEADTVAPPNRMVGWVHHSQVGLRLHTLAGGHFFVRDHLDRVAAILRADLRDALGAPAPRSSLAKPDRDEVHVWYAVLDDDPGLAAAVHELASSESARAARFRRVVDRRRFIACAVLVRRLLRGYGEPVGTAEFATGQAGKPHLAHDSDLRFSVSHSDGVALVAVASGHREVGVDVERIAPMADLDAFRAAALDRAEQEESARGSSTAEELIHALRLWTAKEALLKATGDGLGIEPNAVGFAGQQPWARWRPAVSPELSRLVGWEITHLPLPGAIGALATGPDQRRLQFRWVTADARSPR